MKKEISGKDIMGVNDLYEQIKNKGYQSDEIVCLHCGKKHDPDSEDFFTITGNVTIGLRGGLIGNNFYKDGRVFKISYFCRKKACMGAILSLCE